MHENVPRLYGADADKVTLHIDSAPAHTAKAVYKWLNDRNISFFKKVHWLANSPQVSLMDLFANGYFKAQLNKRLSFIEVHAGGRLR